MTNGSWTAVLIACVVAGLSGGCANHKKKSDREVPLDRGVTDITPAKGRSAVPPDPSYVSTPMAGQPRFVPVDMPAATPAPMSVAEAAPPADAPVMLTRTPFAPAAPASTPAGTSHQYLVQKGDTLFRIAKTHYGDGNRWQQIASANPGLTPSSLKAGSTIVVP